MQEAVEKLRNLRSVRAGSQDPGGEALYPVHEYVDDPLVTRFDDSVFMVESDREMLIIREELRQANMVSYKDAKRGMTPTIRLTLRTYPCGPPYDVWFTFQNEEDWNVAIRKLRAGALWKFVNEKGSSRSLAIRGQDVTWKVD